MLPCIKWLGQLEGGDEVNQGLGFEHSPWQLSGVDSAAGSHVNFFNVNPLVAIFLVATA